MFCHKQCGGTEAAGLGDIITRLSAQMAAHATAGGAAGAAGSAGEDDGASGASGAAAEEEAASGGGKGQQPSSKAAEVDLD